MISQVKLIKVNSEKSFFEFISLTKAAKISFGQILFFPIIYAFIMDKYL